MTYKTLALAAILPLCACATVTRGTKEAMTIETNPVGALVTISNEKMDADISCTTPCSVKLSRKRGFDVTVEKEGYETVSTKVVTQVAGGGAAGMAGNVLVGGLIGAGVDASTGAMNKFTPNPLVLSLVPSNETVATSADSDAPVEPQDADGAVDTGA